MLSHGIKDAYKNTIILTVEKYTPTAKIYLFGSRARGSHAPGSDIDIALACEDQISPRSIGRIKEDLEESRIPFFIDVVDVNAVSEDMRRQILTDGVVWKI